MINRYWAYLIFLFGNVYFSQQSSAVVCMRDTLIKQKGLFLNGSIIGRTNIFENNHNNFHLGLGYYDISQKCFPRSSHYYVTYGQNFDHKKHLRYFTSGFNLNTFIFNFGLALPVISDKNKSSLLLRPEIGLSLEFLPHKLSGRVFYGNQFRIAGSKNLRPKYNNNIFGLQLTFKVFKIKEKITKFKKINVDNIPEFKEIQDKKSKGKVEDINIENKKDNQNKENISVIKGGSFNDQSP